jgi:hypothetical protein
LFTVTLGVNGPPELVERPSTVESFELTTIPVGYWPEIGEPFAEAVIVSAN